MMSFLRDLPGRFRRLTGSGSYQPEIDGLRFLAIGFVIFGHLMERMTRVVEATRPLQEADRFFIQLPPWAPTGVMLFFAISGFILASHFIRQQRKGGEFQLGPYFMRRATRIVPPYLVVLLAGYLIITLTEFRPSFTGGRQVPESTTLSLAASLVYLHGLIFAALPRNFPPGWSLEIEVQFYVLAPLLFILYFRIRNSLARCGIGGLLLLISMGVTSWAQVTFGEIPRYHFSMVKYMPYFWAGIWLADLHALNVLGRRDWHAGWDSLGVIGLTGLTLAGIVHHHVTASGMFALLDALRVGAILLLFAGAIRGRAFKAACSIGWISFLGGASYSIYLCHMHVMQLVAMVIARVLAPAGIPAAYAWGLLLAVPAVVAGGLVFYVTVERPCMNPAWPRQLRLAVERRLARRMAGGFVSAKGSAVDSNAK